VSGGCYGSGAYSHLPAGTVISEVIITPKTAPTTTTDPKAMPKPEVKTVEPKKTGL